MCWSVDEPGKGGFRPLQLAQGFWGLLAWHTHMSFVLLCALPCARTTFRFGAGELSANSSQSNQVRLEQFSQSQ